MIIPIGLSGFMSSLVAPDRKVGGYVFIGLLVVVEFFNIREAIADWPIHLIIWRVVVDGFMVHGALTAASSPKDFKDIKLEA